MVAFFFLLSISLPSFFPPHSAFPFLAFKGIREQSVMCNRSTGTAGLNESPEQLLHSHFTETVGGLVERFISFRGRAGEMEGGGRSRLAGYKNMTNGRESVRCVITDL